METVLHFFLINYENNLSQTSLKSLHEQTKLVAYNISVTSQ